MIVFLVNAIQRILPRTFDYHKITFLTHPRSVVTIRVTKFNVKKLCIFLHIVSLFRVVLMTNTIPLSSINRFVFAVETVCFYCDVQTVFYIQ
jgi:hypothetical protein